MIDHLVAALFVVSLVTPVIIAVISALIALAWPSSPTSVSRRRAAARA
jgi:hypothetical protein